MSEREKEREKEGGIEPRVFAWRAFNGGVCARLLARPEIPFHRGFRDGREAGKIACRGPPILGGRKGSVGQGRMTREERKGMSERGSMKDSVGRTTRRYPCNRVISSTLDPN